MWQRLQTLYLLISTGLTAALFFCDRAEGVTYTGYIPYLVLIVIITLLDIVALSGYKFRVFQFRTAILSALFSLALQGWLAFEFVVSGNDPVFSVTAVFPFACIILDVLAARNIWADELIVRSSSRLRSAKRRK